MLYQEKWPPRPEAIPPEAPKIWGTRAYNTIIFGTTLGTHEIMYPGYSIHTSIYKLAWPRIVFFLASICHAITDPPVTKIRLWASCGV